jgi:hypothetical protein
MLCYCYDMKKASFFISFAGYLFCGGCLMGGGIQIG